MLEGIGDFFAKEIFVGSKQPHGLGTVAAYNKESVEMKLLQHGADRKHSDLEASLIKWSDLYNSELRVEHTGTSFPSYLQQDPISWISLYREVTINDEIADTRFNVGRMYLKTSETRDEGRYLMKKSAERCKELQQQVPCELNDTQLNNIAYIYCRVGMYREALDILEKLVCKEQKFVENVDSESSMENSETTANKGLVLAALLSTLKEVNRRETTKSGDLFEVQKVNRGVMLKDNPLAESLLMVQRVLLNVYCSAWN